MPKKEWTTILDIFLDDLLVIAGVVVATQTKIINGMKITYNNDQATKNAIFEKLLNWFLKFEAFDGDTIFQCDAPNLDSPHILGKIAEDIFEFDIVYDEEF